MIGCSCCSVIGLFVEAGVICWVDGYENDYVGCYSTIFCFVMESGLIWVGYTSGEVYIGLSSTGSPYSGYRI